MFDVQWKNINGYKNKIVECGYLLILSPIKIKMLDKGRNALEITSK
jgi:hypothetical protein